MTVQRITFEDRGQDFLWWEIQSETGRIVGCGPAQGSIWASGKTSVDMATIALGQRPRFFSEGTGPKGRTMLYAVVRIAAATSGGWPSKTDLTELLAIVTAKVTAAQQPRDRNDYTTRRIEGQRIALELEAEHGARFSGSDPMTMKMAGIRASCTSGHFGLFTNWQNAARRRLAKTEAV